MKNMPYLKKLGGEITYRTQIFIKDAPLQDTINENKNIKWIHPKINQYKNTDKNLYTGKWIIEIIKIKKGTCFKEISKLVKENNFEGANIFHTLELINSNPDIGKAPQTLLAPASLYLDDFGELGCVVFDIQKKNKIHLGLGNWRGHKIKNFSIIRIKKIP